VNYGEVADEYAIADQRGVAAALAATASAIDMDDGAVLDVAARADADVVQVTSQHAVVPDRRSRADLDIAYHLRAGGDEGVGSEARRAASKGVEAHCGRSAQ